MVEKNPKKELVLLITGLVTLLILVIGATYAYFTFSSNNEFDSQTLDASTGALGKGVILTKTGEELKLDVSAIEMLEENVGSEYYASGDGSGKTIGTMHVDGAGTFECRYTMQITKSASSEEKDLYNKFQNMENKSEDQLYLNINNEIFDFNTENLFPITYKGSVYGITEEYDEEIRADLVLINKNFEQTALNGGDITLTLEITEFDCDLIEDIPTTDLVIEGNGVTQIAAGTTYQFDAYMADYSETNITWALSEEYEYQEGTSISQDGLLTISENETHGQDIRVVATADNGSSAEYLITVSDIIISNENNSYNGQIEADINTEHTFNIILSDSYSDSEIIWSVKNNDESIPLAEGTSIDANGNLTIGEEEYYNTLIVTATLNDDESIYGEYYIYIKPAPIILTIDGVEYQEYESITIDASSGNTVFNVSSSNEDVTMELYQYNTLVEGAIDNGVITFPEESGDYELVVTLNKDTDYYVTYYITVNYA